MNERELIDRLGLPDLFVGPEDHILSNAWICFTCGETTTNRERVACPAPCWRCGGIMFQTWTASCPDISEDPEH